MVEGGLALGEAAGLANRLNVDDRPEHVSFLVDSQEVPIEDCVCRFKSGMPNEPHLQELTTTAAPCLL
jgi:hypothetical protein